MEFLIEYGLFILKALTIIIFIFISVFFLASSMRQAPEKNETLKIKNLTKRYQSMANSLKVLTMNKEEKKNADYYTMIKQVEKQTKTKILDDYREVLPDVLRRAKDVALVDTFDR